MLSFLWPGLGQLYLGERRKAVAHALPRLLLLASVVVGLLVAGPALLVWLLVPGAALIVLLVTALHGLWSVVSIVDASGHPREAPGRFTPALGLAVVLAAAVATAHLAALWTMRSVSEAGEQVFGVDQPTGGNDLDQALGGGDAPAASGDPDASPTAGDEVGCPCPSASPGSPDGGPAITDPIGTIPAEGPINVLFIGVDSGPGRAHALTDTLFVASYLRDSSRLTMISIPRDTGRTPLYVGGTFRPKINEFLGFANRRPELFPDGGVRALMRQVGHILGIDIHFYAATDLRGFPVIVDLIGGVTVTNPSTLWLDSGEILEPGPVHLDGTRALMYSRARHGPNNNDWERARRQQQVVRAIAQKMATPAMLPRLPALIDVMAEYARTNAEPLQLPELVPILIGAAAADAEHIVLQPDEYARRLPTSETGGLYMTELRMAVIADLSRRLFGAYSRYAAASGSTGP
jgi:LCP family protein required for cell wall assembly